jgi:predicted enzyme related to lactoylglutathione lyase
MTTMNRVAHFEIHAEDVEKVKEFYTSIFGWEIKKWEGGSFDYWIIITGPQTEAGGINGGLIKRHGAKPTDGAAVNAYVCTISVADIQDMAKKVFAAGGKEALPIMAIPNMAWLGYFKDPEGNIFGMIQDDKNAK